MPRLRFFICSVFLMVSFLLPKFVMANACENELKPTRQELLELKKQAKEILRVGPSLRTGSTNELRKVFTAAPKNKLTRHETAELIALVAHAVRGKLWVNTNEELLTLKLLNQRIKTLRVTKKNAHRQAALMDIIDICNDRIEDSAEHLQDFDEDDALNNNYLRIKNEIRSFVALRTQAEDLL